MNSRSPFRSTRPVRILGFSRFFFPGLRADARVIFTAVFLLAANSLLADATNAVATPLSVPALPEAGVSLIRVTGALALVLGLFLGGAWLFKNWQRISLQRGRQPKLNILETRSLGARQAIFVVGYERQRFLLATSPAGVNLLSHLPDAEANGPEATPAETPGAPMPFAQALMQVLKRK